MTKTQSPGNKAELDNSSAPPTVNASRVKFADPKTSKTSVPEGAAVN